MNYRELPAEADQGRGGGQIHSSTEVPRRRAVGSDLNGKNRKHLPNRPGQKYVPGDLEAKTGVTEANSGSVPSCLPPTGDHLRVTHPSELNPTKKLTSQDLNLD